MITATATDCQPEERKRRDVCRCGDYRYEHVNGTGRCKLNDYGDNGGLTHGFAKCMTFRLFKREGEK